MKLKKLLMNNIIKAYHGQDILVDSDDFEYLNQFVWKVILKVKVYKDVQSTHFGKIVRMSRLVMKVTDPKILVDHINGNTFDNRKENLRLCNNKENSRNIGKRKGNYTSKYKGVNWNLQSNKWTARINTDNGRKFLGYFNNEKDAGIAYNEAAKLYHREFARLNNIED
jgi:hypothetical protein